MAHRHGLSALITMAVIVPLALAGWLLLTDSLGEDKAASRVPFPVIPDARDENCVADTEFMRRHHMDMLRHQRDETVLQGMRGGQYSLKECVNCHAVPGTDAEAVPFTSPKHFCRSCHDYAAVKIDCFQCHASRPDTKLANIGRSETVARAGRE